MILDPDAAVDPVVKPEPTAGEVVVPYDVFSAYAARRRRSVAVQALRQTAGTIDAEALRANMAALLTPASPDLSKGIEP